MKVGFAGLGNMGGGMARNVLQAGFELFVYNRTRVKAETLEATLDRWLRPVSDEPPVVADVLIHSQPPTDQVGATQT